MLLSIIIPIYNVEQYIARCIESCLNQDLSKSEYELVMVNDGTPDNSMDIVNKYAQNNTNIHIIEQENKGLSEARNAGLRNAHGEYVWFIDSDDWIKDNCLNEITSRLKNGDLDALQIPMIKVYHNKQVVPHSYKDKDSDITTGKELLKKYLYCYPVQFTLYKRSFLNTYNLSFYPHIYHEDMEFTPRAFFYANRVGFHTTPVYYYELRNASSIMHTPSVKRAVDMTIIIKNHISFFKNIVKEDQFLPIFGTIIGQLINNSLSIIRINKDNNALKDYVGFLNKYKSDIYRFMHHSFNPYFWLESIFFRISPNCLVIFYNIVHFGR